MAFDASERDLGEALTELYFANRYRLLLASKGKQCAKQNECSLPLSRIKRIMKQDATDEQRRCVSADAIPLMAFSTQLLIGHITHLARKVSMEADRRNTIQLKDIKKAITSTKKFDFLVDVLDEFDHLKQEQQHLKDRSKSHVAARGEAELIDINAAADHMQDTGVDSTDEESNVTDGSFKSVASTFADGSSKSVASTVADGPSKSVATSQSNIEMNIESIQICNESIDSSPEDGKEHGNNPGNSIQYCKALDPMQCSDEELFSLFFDCS